MPNATALPPRGGVGLKPAHLAAIFDTAPDLGFFEIHAENYMGDGGPPHRWLTLIRQDYPLSLHGIGLSIGGARPLARAPLARLGALIHRYPPGMFSEHLAWSSHETGFLNDLLPVPYTDETLSRVASHIDQVQEALGRQMLLENPSTYLRFAESTWDEVDFIAEVARRTGCGLLLDVNNVMVTCTNQLWDPAGYIARYPLDRVQEIHLAGHAREEDEAGRPLLIDSHDRPVSDPVWQLYAHAIALTGPLPTLIEWDNDVPEWPTLLAEAHRADAVMARTALVQGELAHAV